MEINQREYQAVILGALLHDVGKFYQRAGFKLEAEDDYWITIYCKEIRFFSKLVAISESIFND